MYSQATSEQDMDTIRRTNVMIVTKKGFFIPATSKKYYPTFTLVEHSTEFV